MILEDTAKYLKKGKSSFYKMARGGKISAVKIEHGRNNLYLLTSKVSGFTKILAIFPVQMLTARYIEVSPLSLRGD
jgi:hypothetical protein